MKSNLTDAQKECITQLWYNLDVEPKDPIEMRQWHSDFRKEIAFAFDHLFRDCERCPNIVPCEDGKSVCVQEARMHASNGDPGDPAEYEWHCNECIEKSEDYDG